MAERRLLAGWGRTSPSAADVVDVDAPEVALKALADPPARGVLARGLGRSYGDAAQNAGGTVLAMAGLARVHALDLEAGTATVDAGCRLDHLLRLLVPLGWTLPVLPGTAQVTVGGAIAADVHGKGHHVDGSFCRHVLSLELALAGGEVRSLAPDDDAFAATAGGLGLTGAVLRATLALRRIETSWLAVDTERATDLDHCFALLAAGDAQRAYSVAWVDCLARGRALGRGVVTSGDHATLDQLPAARRRAPLAPPPTRRLPAPPWAPSGLVRSATVRAFDEAWFRKAPRSEHGALQPLQAFFHPLDAVEGWNRVYGPHGFVQHQLVVPEHRHDVVRATVERLSAARLPAALVVLKRFGPQDGLLSFPMAGWTLAVDLPAATPGLRALLHEVDDNVVAAGGRLYLAKDSRVRPELVAAMYPRLDAWRAVRDELDPGRVMVSDLARRLRLVAP